MWDQVTDSFAQMLANRIYPALFGNPDYQVLLLRAGIKPPFPRKIDELSTRQRKILAQEARLRARLLGLDIESLKALEPTGANAVELTGALHVYRLWNSEKPHSKFGSFWFTEELLRKSFQDGRTSKKKRIEWLRGQLAVAENWNSCDRLARLRLGTGETIPAVEATGLPARRIDNQPRRDGTVLLPDDYIANYDKYASMLPGGAPQIFLFLLPNHVEDYWS